MGKTDDGVHWRTNFVAHVGQEGALGAVGRLGLVLGQCQLVRSLIDQLGQMVAVLIELGLRALALRNVGNEGDQMILAVELDRGCRDADIADLATASDKGGRLFDRRTGDIPVPQPLLPICFADPEANRCRGTTDQFAACPAEVLFIAMIDVHELAVAQAGD